MSFKLLMHKSEINKCQSLITIAYDKEHGEASATMFDVIYLHFLITESCRYVVKVFFIVKRSRILKPTLTLCDLRDDEGFPKMQSVIHIILVNVSTAPYHHSAAGVFV